MDIGYDVDDPRKNISAPVLLQEYRGDVIRHAIRIFEEKGISLSCLLDWQKTQDIIYPWYGEYGTERLGYNRFHQSYPLAIIKAKHISEIKWALTKCIDLGIKFSIRSGGHDHTGLSLSDGIIICLANRNHVIIGKDSVDIGTGARFGQLDMILSNYGTYTAIHGTCSNVSNGLVLGGGFGLYTRKYGLSCDNLISANILLANGKHVTCDKNNYSDLFWALRGAGACSFGIVTDLKLKYYEIGEITLYEFNYSSDQLQHIIDKWQRFAPYAPDDLASKMVITPLSQKNEYPITIKGQYLGSKANLELLLRPFKRECKKWKIWSSTVVDASIYHNESSASPSWYFFYQSMLVVEPLNKQLINIIYEYMLTAPEEHCMIINALGGKFSKINSCDTAFPWRNSILWIHLLSDTKRHSDYDDMRNKVNETYNDLLNNGLRNKDTGVGRLYTNFRDIGLSNKHYPLAYWGKDNYKRLQLIKRKYDPNNVFSHKQGITL